MALRWLLVLLLLACGPAAARMGGKAIPPTAGTIVQTITLVSTSGVDVAANTPSPPMFGLQFQKGQIRAGDYPQLQATDGTPWPATFINRSSWSDGSIKHISVLPGPFPKIIGCTGFSCGNPPATANVLSGGAAPTPSGITLAQLYSEGCQLNADGFAGALGTGLGLQGNWAALLANDANNAEAISYGDGGGGPVWRILTHVQSGGTAHGQMEVYWYVQGIVNTGGAIVGWRLLPRLTQPWYNIDSPTAKDQRGLQDFTIACGATTVTPPFQYLPADITWSSGGNFNVSSTNWYTGGGLNGAYSDIVYGYLTTTGTLPAGLNLNTIYYANALALSPTLIQLSAGATTSGTGVHTFHPIQVVKHFGTVWGAQANGRPTYFPCVAASGCSAVATDAPIRITFDNVARRATKVFPPFDLSLTPVDSNPTSASGYSYSWDTATVGPMYWTTGSSGERPDIGLLNSWQTRHFYNQAAIDELFVRTIGLAGAYLTDNVREHTTRMPVRLDDPANTYTGLPASLATTFNWDTKYGYTDGFTGPASGGLTSQFFNANEMDHMPHMAAYAYLVTGEPQYLDVEVEIAATSVGAGWSPSALRVLPERNPLVNSVQYYGIITYTSDNGIRKMTWALREIIFASALYPDTDPYSTQVKDYLTRLRSQNIQFINTWINASNSYLKSTGTWVPVSGGVNAWMLGYVVYTMGLAAGMAEDADAVTFLNFQSTYYNHILTTFNGWMLHDFYKMQFPTGVQPNGGADGTPITSALGYGMFPSVDGIEIALLTWTVGATPAFTWSYGADMAFNGFVPTNGDKILWPSENSSGVANTTIPGGFSAATPYYAINVSGDSFDLSATIGGPRIAPTTGSVSSAPVGEFAMAAIAPTSTGIGAGYPVVDGYLSNFRGQLNYMVALGITGLGSVATDTTTRFNSMLGLLGVTISQFYKSNPKYAVGSSF